ncbi:hypothetical protein D9758_003651 [Tetrapyrgos nigripes]|uniref:Uncharacterized protein n=1 Tax=Tetrapyrgos nigripes TaxID=182062 RepID=A0A8H5GMF8_9AGAR|nr:hypothetical protein D9758_003651 [Tetrapyrgos nigripes]
MARVDVALDQLSKEVFFSVLNGEDPEAIVAEHEGKIPGLLQMNAISDLQPLEDNSGPSEATYTAW